MSLTASRLRTTPFLIRDPRFHVVLGDDPRLLEVARVPAHEGPVYLPERDELAFTTVPQRPAPTDDPLVSILRLRLDGLRFPVERAALATVVADANAANGMTRDLFGGLLVCEQGTRTRPAGLTRVDPLTGARETLVDSFEGIPLNSPNDVALAPDGAVWFTDPSYGHLQGFRPAPSLPDAVYRLDPRTGRLVVADTGFDKPNGLALSPDGSTLYVADSGTIQGPGPLHPDRPHDVHALAVGHDGIEARRRLAVVEPGFPDGLKVDDAGRVYVSCASGVQVFSPDGTALGDIMLPGAVNFCFGGAERNVLFITADTAIWAAVLNAKGT